jgi:UDP-N-acetylmuramate--alanine ligase
MRARGHRNVTALTDVALLAPLVSELATAGDLVVCLGAGTITAWANALPQELEEIYAAKDAAKDPRAAEAG